MKQGRRSLRILTVPPLLVYYACVACVIHGVAYYAIFIAGISIDEVRNCGENSFGRPPIVKGILLLSLWPCLLRSPASALWGPSISIGLARSFVCEVVA